MTRGVPVWTVALCAAIGFVAALFLGLGVIESITVAALVTIVASFVRQLAASFTAEAEGPDDARD